MAAFVYFGLPELSPEKNTLLSQSLSTLMFMLGLGWAGDHLDRGIFKDGRPHMFARSTLDYWLATLRRTIIIITVVVSGSWIIASL